MTLEPRVRWAMVSIPTELLWWTRSPRAPDVGPDVAPTVLLVTPLESWTGAPGTSDVALPPGTTDDVATVVLSDADGSKVVSTAIEVLVELVAELVDVVFDGVDPEGRSAAVKRTCRVESGPSCRVLASDEHPRPQGRCSTP